MTDVNEPVPPPQAAPPPPPVSRRNAPRFATRERHRELAEAFRSQGGDYDRLRPGYPQPVLDALGAHLPAGARDAVDLGAGTGKLTHALVAAGLDVVAVDPSASMLAIAVEEDPDAESPPVGDSPSIANSPSVADSPAADGAPGAAASLRAPASRPGTLRTQVATAEETGLPDDSADLITVAQAWHWFDTAAACREIRRTLRPGGVLALLWNSLDVQIPWVHRYSRIMHAGDVQRDDFSPPIAPEFTLLERTVQRWEDPRTTQELIDLARTRSYVITAAPERREKVLANLDWYLHEHLGHAPGSTVGMPYRTDLFLFTADA